MKLLAGWDDCSALALEAMRREPFIPSTSLAGARSSPFLLSSQPQRPLQPPNFDLVAKEKLIGEYGQEVLGCRCAGGKTTHGTCGYHFHFGSNEDKPWCRTKFGPPPRPLSIIQSA